MAGRNKPARGSQRPDGEGTISGPHKHGRYVYGRTREEARERVIGEHPEFSSVQVIFARRQDARRAKDSPAGAGPIAVPGHGHRPMVQVRRGPRAVAADRLVPGRDTVRMLEAAIEAQQPGWTNYFHANGIMPLTVEYECWTPRLPGSGRPGAGVPRLPP